MIGQSYNHDPRHFQFQRRMDSQHAIEIHKDKLPVREIVFAAVLCVLATVIMVVA